MRVKREKIPTIRCQNCQGAGRVHLAPQLLTILKLMRSHKNGITSTDAFLTSGEGVAQTAMNNRLEELRRHGLAKRKRNGRAWIYKATT